MDVTSLLNSAGTAKVEERRDSIELTPTPSAVGGSTASSSVVPTPSPERTPPRRTSESRSPNRSRTPWDAGGYSLPLTLDTKFIRSPPTVRTAISCDSPTDVLDSASPKSQSPRHKFTDSRSSLSSYTTASSNNSVSHSRISSLSTVSEYEPMGSLITNFSSLETRMSDKMDATVDCVELDDMRPQSPTPVRSSHEKPSIVLAEPSPRNFDRAQSPSDAILITRSQHEPIGLSPRRSVLQTYSSSQLPPSSLLQPDSSPTRGHKRAVSAPDFPSIDSSSSSLHRLSIFPTIIEPTPPSSQDADRRDSISMSSPPTPPLEAASRRSSDSEETRTITHDTATTSPDDLAGSGPNLEDDHLLVIDGTVRCLYREDCNTGSQLRKAISHLFGRNKLCTRMIPDHVWVHYCRKHYQRARYRNGRNWPKIQCELVTTQVRRLQVWSDKNVQEGNSGVVKDWALCVRKREEKRLEQKTSNKRRREDSDDEVNPDGTMDRRAELNGTAVPQWLLDERGEGYTVEKILQIVARLTAEIKSEALQQIPDIEILPNITQDGDDDNKKTYAKRKPTAHKRSQSVGHALRPESAPMLRRGSQPINNWTPGRMDEMPLEKRRRHEDDMFMDPMRRPERNGAMMNRMQLTHRPMVNAIPEHQAQDNYYPRGVVTPNFGYGQPFHGPPQQTLPAPVPQRFGNHSMAQQLESGYNRRPNMHQRSQSEVRFPAAQYQQMQHGRPTSSNGFPPQAGYSSYTQQVPPMPANNYGPGAPMPPPMGNPNPFYTPAYQSQAVPPQSGYLNTTPPTLARHRSASNSASPASRHARHQSSPAVTRMMPGIPTSQGMQLPQHHVGYSDQFQVQGRPSPFSQPGHLPQPQGYQQNDRLPFSGEQMRHHGSLDEGTMRIEQAPSKPAPLPAMETEQARSVFTARR